MFNRRIGDDKNWVNIHHYNGGEDYWLHACEVEHSDTLVTLTKDEARALRDALTEMLGDGE